MKKKISFYRLSACCFILILFLVFLGNLLIKDKTFSSEENRVLEQVPEFSPSLYLSGRYEKRFENYANDQFMFRNALIRVNASQKITVGTLVSNGVIRGKDHYLLEENNRPDAEFRETGDSVVSFAEKYNNIKIYFLLAPNAANILSDRLPATVRTVDQNKYLDEFFTKVKNGGVTPLDVRKVLRDTSKKEQVYYRTDHHWTTEGAYTAYKSVLKTLGLKDNVKYQKKIVKNDFRGTLASKSGFPNGKNDAITVFLPENGSGFKNSIYYYADTKEKTTRYYKTDNLSKKDAYQVFGGPNHSKFTVETPVTGDRVLLLFKDSYANCFIPFLTQNFRKIIVIDPRYYFGSVDTLINSENVTHIMFLYNANTLFTDKALKLVLTED